MNEHYFQEGEKVYCYDPTVGRARLLYEAKITALVRRKTTPFYRLAFSDWNKVYADRPKKYNYDHDISQDFIRPRTQIYERLTKKLVRIACGCTTDEELKSAVSQHILKSYREKRIKTLPPALEGDDDISNESYMENISTTDPESVEKIALELPESLMKVLEEDCFKVKCENLMPHNAGYTVIEILEAFLRHYSHQLLYDRPKNTRDLYKPELRIELTKEILEGIRCLFDVIFESNLLYNEEVDYLTIEGQTRLLAGHTVKGTADQDSVHAPDVKESHLKKRQTRSSASQISTSEILSDEGKTENFAHSADEAGSLQRRAKFSVHLQANLNHDACGLTIPNESNAFLKELNDWRLLPGEIAKDADKLPSLTYGAIHLLRLFVNLPEVLRKMKLDKERNNLVLRVLNSLISFMDDEKEALMEGTSYLPSASSRAELKGLDS